MLCPGIRGQERDAARSYFRTGCYGAVGPVDPEAAPDWGLMPADDPGIPANDLVTASASAAAFSVAAARTRASSAADVVSGLPARAAGPPDVPVVAAGREEAAGCEGTVGTPGAAPDRTLDGAAGGTRSVTACRGAA